MTTAEFNILEQSVINEVRIELQDMGWLQEITSIKFIENKVIARTWSGMAIHFAITNIEFLNIANTNDEFVETDIRFDIGEPEYVFIADL